MRHALLAILPAALLACAGGPPRVSMGAADVVSRVEGDGPVDVHVGAAVELEINGYPGRLRVAYVVIEADTDDPRHCLAIVPMVVGVETTLQLVDDDDACSVHLRRVLDALAD